MPSNWFRLPETGDGSETDPYRPALFGHDVDGWAGNQSHPDGPPKVIARVYADQQTLESLANEPGVQRLDNTPVQALNQMFNKDHNAEAWNQSFRIGGDDA